MEGFEKGEICNRDDCKGIIQEKDLDGGCSCHINPPCGYCTTPKEYCPICDWDAEENAPTLFMTLHPKKIEQKLHSWMYTPKPPKYRGDDLKPIWNVNQYFDEIFEKRVKSGITKEEAEIIVSKYKRSIYTKLDISKGDNNY